MTSTMPLDYQASFVGPQLDSLDDNLLQAVFKHLHPLPDLFNVAASCRRFRDLALDRRSWLFVTHVADSDAPRGSSSAPEHQKRRRLSLQPLAPSSASLGSAAAAPLAAAASGEEAENCHWYRSQFGTLEAALAASRPGDTILLEAGPVPHVVESPLVVPHPVHILGGGGEAGECVVVGARGIEALFDFRASGRLANLTVKATAGACIAHTRGRLTVQGCTLECDARGLPHLAAPLLTRAVSGVLPPATPAAAAGNKQQLWPDEAARAVLAQGATVHSAAAGRKRTAAAAEAAAAAAAKDASSGGGATLLAAKRPCTWLGAAGAAAAGAGVLSVVETRIKAHGLAVDLRGSGQLAGVRAIYSTGHALVWLEVDSTNLASTSASGTAGGGTGSDAVALPGQAEAPEGGSSGGSGSCMAATQTAGPAAAAGAAAVLPSTPLPSWVARAAAAGFDAAAFQRKAQLLASRSPGSGPDLAASDSQQQPQQLRPAGDASMEQKAEAWCVLHHTSLAAAPEPSPLPPAAQE